MEEFRNTFQRFWTCKVDFVEKYPAISLEKGGSQAAMIQHLLPITRSQRLHKWPLHKAECKFPLILDMLNFEVVNITRKIVPY
jgi:hypothetical protein